MNYSGNPDDEEYTQTAVRFNTKDGKIKTSESCFNNDEIVKLSKDDTYCMSFSDNSLTIKPISEYFSDWGDNEMYFLIND